MQHGPPQSQCFEPVLGCYTKLFRGLVFEGWHVARGAASSAAGVVVVVAVGFHLVVVVVGVVVFVAGAGVAIASVTEVVESVRDSVYRHLLWQNSG